MLKTYEFWCRFNMQESIIDIVRLDVDYLLFGTLEWFTQFPYEIDEI